MRSGSRFCLLLLLALGFSSPASALTFDLDVQVVGRADVGTPSAKAPTPSPMERDTERRSTFLTDGLLLTDSRQCCDCATRWAACCICG